MTSVDAVAGLLVLAIVLVLVLAYATRHHDRKDHQ